MSKADYYAKLGAILRSRRAKHGMSIAKLAELSGCSVRTIIDVELGRKVNGVFCYTVYKLLSGMGESQSALYGEIDE